ncbi:uncharacterized protein G2W53_007390 [Senna tora]|uniref:Uncharacterized protein n=1 Tax=Senna tora TaxID=362788 RepID=A0A834X624_9FABA|nr:uncharacterized protein G2W53_007390 [Senna tora]
MPAELAAETLDVGATGLLHRKPRRRENREFPTIVNSLCFSVLYFSVCGLLFALVCVGWSLNKGLKIAMGIQHFAIEAKVLDLSLEQSGVAHGVKEKEQGNKSTFKRTLRIFLEEGGKRRVQWSQVQQGSSVQEIVVETDDMKRDVGVQTEKDEIVVLGDVRDVELAGKGQKGTNMGESAPCKGKAIMEVQEITNVTLRDPSSSGVIKCLEPETDSSLSEVEEGEFLDGASIISFFDNEEGLLIE